MDQFLAIVTNPILYTAIGGIIAAFYTVWTLARQQYLGIDKLFNLLALSLTAGWFGGWLVQSIANQVWQHPSLGQLWVHPRPWVVLAAYGAMWLVSTRYIRAIRYPYWRLMDMFFIAVAILQSALMLGWAIQRLDMVAMLALLATSSFAIGLIWLYYKIQRAGIIAGLQSAAFFSLMAVLYFMVPAWQGQSGSVEWVADIVGIILGAVLVILRISAKSEKVILQDIPRGVSQSFYETFTRTFSKKSTNQESGK